jgi:hypothetical protein
VAISEPFIRRPIATSLLMAAILLVGAAAYPFIPVAPLPQVDFPTIQITTMLPGADPVTMASSVTAPLERQFAQIPGVTQMTSSSVLGVSSITVQFDLNRNIDAAAGDIQSAINAAGGQLPKNLPSPPSYKKVNPAEPPILIFAVHSDALPIEAVDDAAENPGAEHQPDFRRGAGQCARAAEAGGPDPDRSREDRGHGAQPRGPARGDRERHHRQPERQHRRRDPHLHHLRQRSVAGGQALE